MTYLTYFFKSLLNAVGQMVFIENPYFGAAILGTLIYLSPVASAAVIIATGAHIIIAPLWFKKEAIESGMTGFNLIISVLAIYTFMNGLNSLGWALLLGVVYTALMKLMTHIFNTYRIPLLSCPSVLFTYLFFFVKAPMVGTAINTAPIISNLFVDSGVVYFQSSVLFATILLIGYAFTRWHFIFYHAIAYAIAIIVQRITHASTLDLGLLFNISLVFMLVDIQEAQTAIQARIKHMILLAVLTVGITLIVEPLLGPLPLLSLPYFIVIIIYQSIKKTRALH